MPETAGQAGRKRNAAGGTEPAGSWGVLLSIAATGVKFRKTSPVCSVPGVYGKEGKRSTR